MNFAELLRTFRIMLDFSQDELADGFGIDRATYNAYESEKLQPPTDFLRDVAYCLMLNKNYFDSDTELNLVDLLSLTDQREDNAEIQVIENTSVVPRKYRTESNDLMFADSGNHYDKVLSEFYKNSKTERPDPRESLSPALRKEYDRQLQEIRRLRFRHEMKQALEDTEFPQVGSMFSTETINGLSGGQSTLPFSHDEIRLLIKYRLLKLKCARENKPLTIDDFLIDYLSDQHKE
ncbi:MAG: helix-turn-helix transcriptional regulator [Clostridia bacterium]|nr:helix-turn-helix transcriptional regulator [Clostridia bacterium]